MILSPLLLIDCDDDDDNKIMDNIGGINSELIVRTSDFSSRQTGLNQLNSRQIAFCVCSVIMKNFIDGFDKLRNRLIKKYKNIMIVMMVMMMMMMIIYRNRLQWNKLSSDELIEYISSIGANNISSIINKNGISGLSFSKMKQIFIRKRFYLNYINQYQHIHLIQI